mmetsp:Transcript_7526/g.22061  ORF Transcript_7526/g.22061 Transcript_7526/m.22061 type:complete len:263 (-) Transcript_7526:254-1042(-)
MDRHRQARRQRHRGEVLVSWLRIQRDMAQPRNELRQGQQRAGRIWVITRGGGHSRVQLAHRRATWHRARAPQSLRLAPARDRLRLRCGHGVLSYGSTSPPRDAATRQLTKRPLFDLPTRTIVRKQVFLHPNLDQNLLPAESRKAVSFRPDNSRADLPSEHRVYLQPTPSLAGPDTAQPMSSPFSELMKPIPQPAAKRRKVAADGAGARAADAPQPARGSSPQECTSAAAPLVQATLAPLQPAGRPQARARRVNHYLCTCKAI